MTNPNLRAILYQIMDDSRKEKICLIENIIRAKTLLVGFGDRGYDSVLKSPGDEFDRLYDLSINSLEIIDGVLSARVNRRMQEKMAELGGIL